MTANKICVYCMVLWRSALRCWVCNRRGATCRLSLSQACIRTERQLRGSYARYQKEVNAP